VTRRRIAVAFAALVGAGLVAPGALVPPEASAQVPPGPAESSSAVLPGFSRSSSPTVADIDGDGVDDVVIGHQDGWVRVYRSGDAGSLLWERPAIPHVPPACRPQGTPTAIEASPTVADLDDDGANEIIVAMGSTHVRDQNGGLVVFNRDGSVRWTWGGNRDKANTWDALLADDGWCEGVFSTPAVGDVDGDGRPEIVFGGWDQRLHVLDANGNPLPGTPWDNLDTIWSSPALFDVDGDGSLEIFVGVDMGPLGHERWLGGVFRSFDYENGGLHQRWSRLVEEVVDASPAIGDINGDGRYEAVVSTGWDYALKPETAHRAVPAAHSVFAFHLDDGSDVPGWPQRTTGTVKASPALGDLTGDGIPEVIVGSWDRHVYAWRGDGSLLWRHQTGPNWISPDLDRVTGDPVIADLDGDGRQDVAIGTAWSVTLIRGDGSRLGEVNYGLSHENAPAVGSFGPRGRQLFAAGIDSVARTTRLASHPLPPTRAADQWPQWRRSADHLGAPPSGGTTCPAPVSAGASAPLELGTFRPLTPRRVLDTREGVGGVPARARLRQHCVLPLPVADLPGVNANQLVAVTLNVTATQATRPGYLTVFPCGQLVPEASNVNFVPGQDVPNLVTVAVGAGGQVCFYASATVHVVADLSGWYGRGAAARFTPQSPARVLDTRVGHGAAGPVPPGGTLELGVAGQAGVPGDASAVALNVTVTEPGGAGYVTVFPCDRPRPLASNLNYVPGQTVPNHVVVPLSGDGRVCLMSLAGTHLVADVLGWFGPSGEREGSRYRPVPPARLVDTRQRGFPVPAGEPMALPVLGAHGVPGDGVAGVTMNVTVSQPDGPGYLTVYPCGQPAPLASNLNYVAGQDVPNLVSVKVGEGGQVCFVSQRTTHVIADVAGWFGASRG